MAFVKGQSGNPSGRPKITLADGRSLKDVARGHTEKALNALVAALDDDSTTARIAAARELLDRGWGKSTQPISGDEDAAPIQHKLDVSGLSTEALAELARAKPVK